MAGGIPDLTGINFGKSLRRNIDDVNSPLDIKIQKKFPINNVNVHAIVGCDKT